MTVSPTARSDPATKTTRTLRCVLGGERSRRREFCHFADIPSPSMLKRLLKGEGDAAE